jgi:hypothetical protein
MINKQNRSVCYTPRQHAPATSAARQLTRPSAALEDEQNPLNRRLARLDYWRRVSPLSGSGRRIKTNRCRKQAKPRLPGLRLSRWATSQVLIFFGIYYYLSVNKLSTHPADATALLLCLCELPLYCKSYTNNHRANDISNPSQATGKDYAGGSVHWNEAEVALSRGISRRASYFTAPKHGTRYAT